MILSNKNKGKVYFTFFMLIGLIITVSFPIFLSEKRFKNDIGEAAITVEILLSVLIFILSISRQIFDYDSDGEVITIKNRSIFPILNLELHDEFPKYKLKGFKISTFLFRKRLIMEIYSKKNKTIKLKYNISFLSSKEIENLKRSLKQVIKANRDNQYAR